MVKVEDSIVARLESHGHKFEILVDPDATERIRNGEIDVNTDLALDQVFKDARKGDKIGEELLMEIFNTIDIAQIAIEIVKRGQIQLTTEQRKEMLQKRRRQVIEIISRESINPQTNTPNPPARIEQAMEEAKVHIDPFKAAEEQVQTVLKAIRPLLPIRFEKARIAVKLTGNGYGKVYGDLVKGGFIVKEEWGRDGSWIGVLEMPAGMRGEIIDLINRKAHEEAEIKILKTI
ncbi:MAG: ribosome assembly factor SBDS [Candidatus Thermoplasmatota archaeon]|jgi:ribosome maturation protein SDO1|nr:ribosome assembly factor SBDS [Candidatus Thermoplasmatota archaeon]MCL5793363.1 ribosome assembly factor SBDS [Candidatus Thermoplasmatota archaeon]